MKKIFFIFYCLLFITNYSLCQSGWIQLNTGTATTLNKIQFVNSKTGWAGGFQGIPISYVIIKTTDAGLSWTDQSGNFSPYGNRVLSLFFTDANTGYVAGADGLFKTTNGGNNYLILPPMGMACIDCFFINAITGWVSVATGVSEIYKTTNGGTNWASNLYSSFPSPRYTYVRFANSNTGWCVNDSIFKTNNGGINWTRQVLPVIPFHNFYGVYTLSPDTAWIVGTSGIILFTSNGGTNWVIKNLNDYGVISGYFLNSMTGYITTNTSGIYKTTNNGTNWIPQFTDSVNIFNSIYFTSKDTGYVCGSGGKIYKTVNGGSIGIRKIDENTPDKFCLYQNYPNPFNPTTSIRYQVESIKFIKLVVYNILGKEVATLVNEKQSQGVYEVTFDGSMYPSGVYFYRLETENYSETKKMLLIK
jgi:photosystem II stability/assembly factor-like uncharacterized protein